MKATKITYWTATAIIALMMTFSAYAHFTQPMIKESFQHLGYPDYFRIELGMAKLIGAALLLIPVAARLKEWAYAGFTIVFVSAIISHISVGDPTEKTVMPALMLLILAVSYIAYHKLPAKKLATQPNS